MLKLNHIGFVVKDIKEFIEIFRAMGLTEITEAVENPRQRVSASFVNVGENDDVYVELLEPATDVSPISNFLRKRGGGLHHLCFSVDDIEKTSGDLVKKGFTMIVPPEDCKAYDENFKRECGRPSKAAFFMVADRFLVELIEEGK